MTGKMTYSSIIRSLFVLASILCMSASHAQDSKFQAITSKNTVAEGEKFRVEFRFNASGDRFSPPNFQGFRILSGPQQSTNMQFINGKSSYSISFSYVLMALKEGEYKIGPASIYSGGDLVESNELAISVVKGNAPTQNNQGSKSTAGIDDNIFIQAYVSNTKPYVGEQIIATYKLYFNLNIVDNDVRTIPSLTGFWSEDVDFQYDGRETEVVNGVRYNVAVLKKSVLIPQRSGDLTIDPFEMDLIIRQPVQSRSRNVFDQVFGSYKQTEVVASSKPVKVSVLPLPSGKPAGFNGAVGDFKVDFNSDRSDLKSNEAVNFTYTINGKGNIKLLNEPKIDFPSDFEVYDAKLNEKVTVNANGMSGSRTYTYLAIPRHKGDFTVTPESFSYFDPNKEKYFTISPSELQFNIEKGNEESNEAVSFSGTNKEDIKLLGSDIRFIKTETILSPRGYGFFGSLWHYLLWLLPLPLFFVFRFLKLKNEARLSDTVNLKKSKANKMAIRRLSDAKKHISDGDDKKFYEEIFKALYGFFSDKFNLSTSELNKDEIRNTLLNRNISNELIQKTEDILNKCEMARFAPVSDIGHEEVYEESVQVLSELQKGLK